MINSNKTKTSIKGPTTMTKKEIITLYNHIVEKSKLKPGETNSRIGSCSKLIAQKALVNVLNKQIEKFLEQPEIQEYYEIQEMLIKKTNKQYKVWANAKLAQSYKDLYCKIYEIVKGLVHGFEIPMYDWKSKGKNMSINYDWDKQTKMIVDMFIDHTNDIVKIAKGEIV